MNLAAIAAILVALFFASGGSASSLLDGVQIPSAISVPANNSLHVAYSAQGHQHYSFNGTSWVLVNATAKLYSDANRTIYAGRHFFLTTGAQPTWRAENDSHDDDTTYSQVTGAGVAAVTVDSDSITWNLLQATAHSGELEPLGSVTYIQRLQTQRGLPPSTTGANVGDTHASKYFAIYAFYIPS